MPKTPGQVGSEARINLCDSIIPRTFDLTHPLESRSPQQPAVPLPEHLDKLIESPWTLEASRLLDQWIWYVEQGFESVRGRYEG